MKAIEKLALIFMNPFHLDVKEGVGVDVHFVFPLEVCREFQLVFLQIEEAEGSPEVLQLQNNPTDSLFPPHIDRESRRYEARYDFPQPLHQGRHY